MGVVYLLTAPIHLSFRDDFIRFVSPALPYSPENKFEYARVLLAQEESFTGAFSDSFFPAQEMSYYGGTELPGPVERLYGVNYMYGVVGRL